MGELKPAAIGAAIGFVLSFLIGLISGVSFWTICLRAIILAVVCGAVGFFVSVIFKKYLPELFSETGGTGQTEKDLGKNLNIVLDEEASKPVEKRETQIEDSVFEEEEAKPEEQASLGETANAADVADAAPQTNGSGTSLEELPDMSQFANPLEHSIGEVTSDLVDAGTDSVKKESGGEFGSDNVRDMAKAIHTILKKEST